MRNSLSTYRFGSVFSLLAGLACGKLCLGADVPKNAPEASLPGNWHAYRSFSVEEGSAGFHTIQDGWIEVPADRREPLSFRVSVERIRPGVDAEPPVVLTQLEGGERFDFSTFAGFLVPGDRVVVCGGTADTTGLRIGGRLERSTTIPVAHVPRKRGAPLVVEVPPGKPGTTVTLLTVPQSGIYALHRAWAQAEAHEPSAVALGIRVGAQDRLAGSFVVGGSRTALDLPLGYLRKGETVRFSFSHPSPGTLSLSLEATLVEWAPRNAPLRVRRDGSGFLSVLEPSDPLTPVEVLPERWINVPASDGDATEALRKAFAQAAKLASDGGYAGVRLERDAQYRLGSGQDGGALFEIADAHRLLLDGQGATLVVNTRRLTLERTILFDVARSTRLVFADFRIDSPGWNQAAGDILHVSPLKEGHQTVTFRVPEDQPLPSEVVPSGSTVGYAYDAEVPGRLSFGAWSGYPSAGPGSLAATAEPRVFSHTVLRTDHSIPTGGPDHAGKWLVKQKKSGVEILRADSGAEDITLYGVRSGGAIRGGVRFWGAKRVNVLDCRFDPEPGRWISMVADGLHGHAPEGLWVENTRFDAVCEDIANFYHTPMGILSEGNGRIALRPVVRDARAPRGLRLGPLAGDPLPVGTPLLFFDSVAGRVTARATVRQVEADGVVTLSAAIPPVAPWEDAKGTANLTVYDESKVGGFFVRDSEFLNSLRFGLFVKARDTVVFNTVFEGLAGSAVFAANEPDYPEGPLPSRLWLQGNTFRANAFDYDTRHLAFLCVDPAQVSICTRRVRSKDIPGTSVTGTFENSHLRIEENVFAQWRGMGLAIRNARNVHIRNNVFEPPVEDATVRATLAARAPHGDRPAAIFLDSVRGAILSGNRFPGLPENVQAVALGASVADIVQDLPAVTNLPAAFYERPGLEAMPRLDYGGMAVVDVRDLGADPTGGAEANAVFDHALRRLERTGGGILYVPEGRYRFAGPASLPDSRWSWRKEDLRNIHIVGAGPEKTVIYSEWDAVRNAGESAGYLWSFARGNGLSFRDLGFSIFPVFGMRSPSKCEGMFALAFGGCTNVQVVNVTCDQGRMGICFWPGNRTAWVVDCDVRNTAADAIKFDSCVDVVAAYNYVENANDDAFSALHMESGLSANNAFVGNTIVYNHGWGRGIAISGRGHRILGNWIEAQAMPAILFHPLGFKDKKPEGAENAGHVVASNTVVRCDLHAVRGNRMQGHRYGASLAIGYPYRDLTVRGNRVAGGATDGFGATDFTSTRIEDVLLADNRIVGNLGSGIALRSTKEGSFIRRATLAGNVLADNRGGSLLLLGEQEALTCRDNRFDVPAKGAPRTGPVEELSLPGCSLEPVAPGYSDVYREARTSPDETEPRAVPAVAVSGPEFNVRDFGAQGDGRNSDTAPFAAALAAIPDSGGVLRIPAGNYRIEPLPQQDGMPFTCIRHHLAVQGKRNLHLVGEGTNSVLTFTSLGHEGLRLIGITNGSVRNLVLDMAARSPHRKNRAPLDIVASRNLVVEGVASRHAAGHGLRLDACTDVLLDGCEVTDAGQSGVNLLGCRQTTVRHCTIVNSRDYGVNIGCIGGIARMPQFVTVEDCVIRGVREGHGVSVPYGDRISVRRNRIADTYQAGVALYYANAIFPTERVDINDNELTHCAWGPLSYMRGAVSLFHITAQARRSGPGATVAITGNRIAQTPANGIWVDQCRGMAALTVRDNHIDAVGGSPVAIDEAQRAEIAVLNLQERKAMKRVFHIGDSIAVQYGPFLQDRLAGRIDLFRRGRLEEARRDWDVPRGPNQGDSDSVRALVENTPLMKAAQADAVLLNCGLHDIKTDPATGRRQVPVERYRANLAAIVARLAELRIPLFWVSTTPCDESVHNRPGMDFHRFAKDVVDYNRVAEEVMASAGVRRLDLYGFTLALGPDLYCDHVHFHERVRRRQADFLAEGLLAWLAERPE